MKPVCDVKGVNMHTKKWRAGRDDPATNSLHRRAPSGGRASLSIEARGRAYITSKAPAVEWNGNIEANRGKILCRCQVRSVCLGL